MKPGDSGQIAEELINDSGVDEVFLLCRMIYQIISETDIPLERALRMYKISEDQYNNYLKTK